MKLVQSQQGTQSESVSNRAPKALTGPMCRTAKGCEMSSFVAVFLTGYN